MLSSPKLNQTDVEFRTSPLTIRSNKNIDTTLMSATKTRPSTSLNGTMKRVNISTLS